MKHSLRLGLAALVLVLGAGQAAALDLHLDFDHSVAHPGDTVSLSGSVKNADELAVFAYMQVTVRLNGQVMDVFAGRIPLESNETSSSTISFGVPSLLPGGVVTVDLNGRACDSNQTVTATLILDRAVLASDDTSLRDLGKKLLSGFGVEEVPVSVSPSTMGNIKRLYR